MAVTYQQTCRLCGWSMSAVKLMDFLRLTAAHKAMHGNDKKREQ